MKKTDNMPVWVYLAFSSIATRKGASLLIWSCVACTIYCIPWPMYFENGGWFVRICFIRNWSWFAMMVPMTLWYWLSLRWVDKNAEWQGTPQDNHQG